jgi:hypothetical protein
MFHFSFKQGRQFLRKLHHVHDLSFVFVLAFITLMVSGAIYYRRIAYNLSFALKELYVALSRNILIKPQFSIQKHPIIAHLDWFNPSK